MTHPAKNAFLGGGGGGLLRYLESIISFAVSNRKGHELLIIIMWSEGGVY